MFAVKLPRALVDIEPPRPLDFHLNCSVASHDDALSPHYSTHSSPSPLPPADGVWLFDNSAGTVLLSSACAALLGLNTERPLRLALADWLAHAHPEDGPKLSLALQDGRRPEWSLRLRLAHDRTGANAVASGVQLHGVAEHDAAGRLQRVGGSMSPWRAQPAQPAPKAADGLLSNAGRIARLGGWSVELPSLRAQWSDEAAAIYGVAPGDAPTRGCGLDFVSPPFRPQAAAAFERCCSSGEPWDLELQIVTPQAELRWVRTIGEARRNEEGAIVGLWGALIDIGRRKKAEAERLAAMRQLQDVSSRLEMALSVAGLGVARLDLATDLAYWNQNLCAILGHAYTPNGRARHEWQAVFHPDDRRAARVDLRRLLSGGASGVREFRALRLDGAVRHLVGQHTLQRDAAGKPASATLVVHDVTEQRQAQAARQSQAMAEQANRAKSEFLARMSHELRTPLNAILGFSEILEADEALALDATQRKRVERIRSAGAHLLELVNDLLDVSRIETGALRLQLVPVDLLAQVGEALRLAGAQAAAREVDLELQGPPGAQALWVQGDSQRLRQVVLNLLTNAIKYNRPRGKVMVHIEQDDRGVALRVRDSGLGMNSQQVAHLFQLFNRLGQEQSTIEGAGIGLVITRHLVELMGGEISVSSQARLGTEFCVRLKSSDAAAVWDHAPATAGRDPRESAPYPGPRSLGRVLYVEDNAVNRALIEGYVSLRPGIELELAVDGESGINQARRFMPDLILIDMMLPDLHGVEVIQRIRGIDTLKRVRCIAVSANAMPRQIEEAAAAGFDGYLTKPVSLQSMLAELDRLVLGA
jgi:PAS domain S-box-containing protein